MDTQNTVDVEVLTPVRNGGPEPIGVGDVVAMDVRQARELERLSAVRILADFDAPTIGLRQAPVRVDRDGGPVNRIYYFDSDLGLQHLGDFASLDDAAVAFAPIAERIAADALGLADQLEAAERLAEERLAEVERLKAATVADEVVGDGAFTGLSADAVEKLKADILGEDAGGGSGPVTPVEVVPPPPVSADMRREELRGVARAEGIAFDDNDTKAELVRKIQAGRLTAQAAA